MDIKLLLKMTKLNQLIYLALPILMSYIYSLYQYDNINWGISFLLAISLITFVLGVNLLKELTLYRQADGKSAEQKTLIGREKINLSVLRYFIIGFFALSLALFLLVSLLTSWNLLLLGIIPAILGSLYATGKKPLFQTAFAEVIVSFGCGFVIPLLMVYGNVYREQSSLIAFLAEMFWVSLPFIFSFAMIQLAYHSVLAQQEENQTMAGIMGRHATNGLIEAMVILSFVLPSLSIYLNYAPGAMILIWLLFPKVWMDTKKFVQQKQQADELSLVRVNAEIIMIFQILLYTLGIFF